MPFLALLVGAVFIVAAIRNSHGALLAALKEDVPSFAIWAAAIMAIAALGFIPNMKPVSRSLLVLVFVVIVLKNYKAILGGFETTWKGAEAQAAQPSPKEQSGPGGSGDLMNVALSFLGGSSGGTTGTDIFGSLQGTNG